MAKVWLTRALAGWIVSDEASANTLQRFPVGTAVEFDVTVRNARSAQWNRKYWAMLGQITPHVERVNIRELGDDGEPLWMPIRASSDLHTALKLVCGHCDKYTVETEDMTHLVRVPKATDFATMTADEWAEYWPKVLDGVHQRVLPTVENRFIENELARMAS